MERKLRISHKKIEKIIQEKIGSMTDREFFTSSAYAEYLMDIAETVSGRYGRPMPVRMCWVDINRHARKFIEDEMKANGEERAGGMIGSDVPDDICYQWALDYFRDSKAEEDKEPEEKFVPKPYTGSGRTRGRTSKKAEEKKPEPKPAAPKNQAPEGQIGFGEMLGAA